MDEIQMKAMADKLGAPPKPLLAKQVPTLTDLPRRLPNESARAYACRMEHFFFGVPRVKTDLQDWTGSMPFHLDRPASNK